MSHPTPPQPSDNLQPNPSDENSQEIVADTTQPRKKFRLIRRLFVVFSRFVLAGALVAMICTIISLGGRYNWALDLLANLRFLYAEFLLFALIVLVMFNCI